MSDDKVVHFENVVRIIEREETNLPDPTMNIVEEKGKYCPHERINLFIHHRTIVCRDCGATLDPFEFIKSLAADGNNHLSQIRWLRHQLKWIEEEKTKLENEVKNLKATKRRNSK